MAEIDHSASNFIRNIIDEDLGSGKHQTVLTRFPPEPNGYLHIGHAKSICLNFGIAADYHGVCNLRFDDTNPEKESIQYVNAIKADVSWLGYQWHAEVRYSSDYFEQLFNYAKELIHKGLAYVDFSSQAAMREMRGSLTEPGENSRYRDTSASENARLFDKMAAGDFQEGECCLRAKIDMASPFMCMRDPVIYRVKFAHHHQTGDNWCVYPMYDFTHCISDAIEKVTHSLCTLEFQDNRRLYDWVIANISIAEKPQQYEFSRLNLEYTLLSKRKLIQLVNEKFVSGWDDPRMPTIAGLRRRGYTPASLRDFCARIGVTKQDNVVEMGVLEACIRDDLNENAARAMAVLDPVKVIIENYQGEEMILAPKHPTKADMGERALPFSREIWIEKEDFREQANKKYKRLVLGKEVRLRNAYVIKAQRVDKDAAGEISAIYCTCDMTTLGKDPADGRKVKGVIHWLSAKHAKPAQFRLYDRLFNIPNPNKVELQDAFNPLSLVAKEGFVEPSVTATEVGQPLQFERLGYFCKDPDSSQQQSVFNRTVALRDTWAKG